MKRTTTLAIAIAAMIPMGAAVAGDQDKAGKMGPSFETLDVNRDGRVSQAETGADASIVFSSADANGDGYLDMQEFKNRQKSGHTMPKPQSQSLPDSGTDNTTPGTPPASEPAPDTETPRQ